MSTFCIDKCCMENCFGTSKSRLRVPKNVHETWEKAIRKTLGKRSRVCGDHFLKHVIDTWVTG